MILQNALYIAAYLVTACVHLLWNDLIKGAISLTVFCLCNPASPILLSMLRLHCLVLVCFVLAICFKTTSAVILQHGMVTGGTNHTLKFDDLATSNGFGNLTDPYHHLSFRSFYPFDPLDPYLARRISPHDLNCAVSLPNALYGASDTVTGGLDSQAQPVKPTIHSDVMSLRKASLAPYFTLHSLKIKPLDIPFSHTTLYIRAHQLGCDVKELKWQVDFPKGFHDMLHVKFEEFTKQKWEKLDMLEFWADFSYDGSDWEFCIDDMEIEFAKADEVDEYFPASCVAVPQQEL